MAAADCDSTPCGRGERRQQRVVRRQGAGARLARSARFRAGRSSVDQVVRARLDGRSRPAHCARRLSHLLPSELATLSSMVTDRSGIFSKKRLLILTDYPRLLLARESKTRLKVKHEIFVGQRRVSSLAPSSNGQSNLETLVEVKAEGSKGFRVFTVRAVLLLCLC
jgi:hypothetical protein